MTAPTVRRRHRDMRQIVRNIDAAEPCQVHPCAVETCRRNTLTGYVACRTHWLALPADVRRVLTDAFRRRETQPELYAEAVAITRRLVNMVGASS